MLQSQRGHRRGDATDSESDAHMARYSPHEESAKQQRHRLRQEEEDALKLQLEEITAKNKLLLEHLARSRNEGTTLSRQLAEVKARDKLRMEELAWLARFQKRNWVSFLLFYGL